MRFAIAVPVLNQPELTQTFLDTIRSTQSKIRDENGNQTFPIVIIDNGSTPPVRDWLNGLIDGDLVIRNDENVGVLPALNQAYQVLKNTVDYIFYLHNDVLVHEQGWDEKLDRILTAANAEGTGVGAAGFYGAKGIGVPGIYRSPYIMQQLIRIENVSNCVRMNAAIHGFRNIRGGKEYEEIAVLDGFSLIVSTKLLKKTDGFDRHYPPHHMYDNDICLESIDKGFRNIVIAMDAEHLGGRTDVAENWNAPFKKEKHEIHQEAHPIFYDKWNPGRVSSGEHKISLPIRVS